MAFYVHISDIVLIGGAGNAAPATSQRLDFIFQGHYLESTPLCPLNRNKISSNNETFLSLGDGLSYVVHFRKITKTVK